MTLRRGIVAVVLVVLVVGAVALWRHTGTDDTTAAPNSTSSLRTAPVESADSATPSTSVAPQSDPGTPESVITRAMTIAYTWTPGIDASPTDGFRRATAYFTPRLTESITVDIGAATTPDRRWTAWADDDARIIAAVQVGCSGCPPDTDTAAHRVATVIQTATTPTTTTAVDPDTTIWITLTRTGDTGWLIDRLSF